MAGHAPAEVNVAISGGYEKIGSYENHGLTYISLSELVEIIGGKLDWAMVGHQVTYHQNSARFELIIGSPYFKLNDTVYNMTYVADFREGRLFVPVQTFLPYIDRITTQKITWDPGNSTVRVESDYFNVTDMIVSAKANGLLIEIYLTQTLSYDVFVTEGNWLNISIRDARLNQNRILSRKDNRYMYTLKAYQVENTTGQISLRLKTSAQKLTHKLVYDPPRIQISLPDANFELDTTPNPVIGPDNRIDVIVIDAGHGGKDYGAIGQRGTREKDVVLQIAKELANRIRKDKHFKVIMTRDRDVYVSLEDRAKIANDAGADLFVSIHANSSPKRHVRGWNVFFLAPAKNDSARSVAQFENSFFLRELSSQDSGEDAAGSDEAPDTDSGPDPIMDILNSMIMTEFQEESYDLAMMVDREFRRSMKIPSRGVDQAGFYVLNQVFTPSVLVETAFISNKTEENLLRDKDFHKDIAEGLYDAIKRFKVKYETK
jgi:N-acetylmuramoyl-L-alanine amidase